MSPKKRIADTEWEVMNVLWQESPLGSGEVVQRLEQRLSWSPRTIKTLLGRLVKKGYLDYEEQANRYLYRPTVGREEVVQDASRSFLDRVFAGDAASLLLHFARETELDADEMAELRQLLQSKEGES